jgi:hypothetical protein
MSRTGPRENVIQQRIRLALGADPDVVLWRNSAGMAEVYDEAKHQTRRQTFGLAPGAADLIGMLRYRLELEGGRVWDFARFLALEVKTDVGRASPEQVRFLELVRRQGGVAELVRSEAEALDVVARAKRGEL